MVKHGIQIFARLKPTKRKTGVFETGEDLKGLPKLTFVVPRKEADGFVNNKKESYNFQFDRIFPQETSQDDVFDHVAKGVIDNVLAGYNGTVFAYGQTGSGKTFTITGGAERYGDRGLIPRSLSYIFRHQEQNPDKAFTTQVTYMEIYNEQGHDLLNQQHEGAKLEDFPKVHLMEDSDGQIALKNLSIHEAQNEEGALNLLFLGDTNRMIAETPMNMASTRSHCIFTIYVTSREPGSAVIRRSKLHLVDLAGSERIGKTGVGGTLLSEAKYINLSLHYLEQVIVALTEKGRTHIPYRNSMMTSVLRDSLGGNCMTSMIATCSVEKGNVDESITTCRFAQRVALIKNDALVNEELSPKLMIGRLQQQVKDLRDELQLATGEQRTEDLTEEERARCVEQVKSYVEQGVVLSVGADMRKIQLCFHILKDLIVESRQELAAKARQGTPAPQKETSLSPRHSSIDDHPSFAYLHLPTEVTRLQELLQQRDSEINVLVTMLKREKRRAAEALVRLDATTGSPRGSSEDGATLSSSRARSQAHTTAASPRSPVTPSSDSLKTSSTSPAQPKAVQDLSLGQREAYEVFRRDYAHTQAMEEAKSLLRERYAAAKILGETVNRARSDITSAKKNLEVHRVSLAVQGVAEGDAGGTGHAMDPKEQLLRERLQEAKSRFKNSLGDLKELKVEIDHRKHLLENARLQMMKDFREWWMKQGGSRDDSHQTPRSSVGARSTSPRTSSHSTEPMPLQYHRSSRSQHAEDNASRSSYQDTGSSRSTSRQSVTLAANFSQPKASSSHRQGSIAYRGDMALPSSSHHSTDTDASSSFDSHVSRTPSSRPVTSSMSLASDRSVSQQAAESISPRTVTLTGDSRADADILAFMKARQNLLRNGSK